MIAALKALASFLPAIVDGIKWAVGQWQKYRAGKAEEAIEAERQAKYKLGDDAIREASNPEQSRDA